MIIKYLKNSLLVLLCFSFSPPELLAGPYDPSASVFRFQKKMAERGIAESQLKLGLMYETGSGVKASQLNALIWYKKAAAQNYKPAINRLTYLEIRKSGFSPQHQAWLKELKKDASFNEGEALFLLGQMYAEGTGVEKDPQTALKLLRKAAAGNIPGSEAEIMRVENELSRLQARNARQKNSHRKKNDGKKSPRIPPVAARPPVKAAAPRTLAASNKAKKKPATPAANRKYSKKTGKTIKPASQTMVLSKSSSKQKTNRHAAVKQRAKAPTQQVSAISVKTEKPSADLHPMDMICGGRNRFQRGCR